jgi:hypothetical protein
LLVGLVLIDDSDVQGFVGKFLEVGGVGVAVVGQANRASCDSGSPTL